MNKKKNGKLIGASYEEIVNQIDVSHSSESNDGEGMIREINKRAKVIKMKQQINKKLGKKLMEEEEEENKQTHDIKKGVSNHNKKSKKEDCSDIKKNGSYYNDMSEVMLPFEISNIKSLRSKGRQHSF
jgi:G3E family GTPase